MKSPSEPVVDAWIALMRAQQIALRKVERAFRAAGLAPYAWYDALWELERAGEEGLRQVQIERQVLIAQSNISRLVDRLEAAKCVARQPCTDDARGQKVVITKAGMELRRRMWPVYAKAIQTAFGDHISDEQAGTLARILQQTLEN
jgi:DNA-binding MarR family transcriptional regulator